MFPRLPAALAAASVMLLAVGCSSPPQAATPTVAPPRTEPTSAAVATSSPTPGPTSTRPGAPSSPTTSPTRGATVLPSTAVPPTRPPATIPPAPTSPPAPLPPALTSTPIVSLPAAGEVVRLRSPESGVQAFLWGSPLAATHLRVARDAGFGWVKQMFQWDHIERDGKGQFQWAESDRLVKAADDAGLRLVARIDFTPNWAMDPATAPKTNGPPQNYSDFGDFIYALVNRYKAGSPYGRIYAYEIWNEPNLAREWGGRAPNASDYVELLKTAYTAAKRADRAAVVVSAGLSPTGTTSPEARPDDTYLEEMYRAGARDYFDVLGAHAAGFKAPPEMSPEEIAARKEYGGQRFFGFRRVEDLRRIMVRNGDQRKQVMVLEMGWTTDNRPGSPYAWHAVSEREKGDYLVRAYRYAQDNWGDWIGLMNTIYISAPHWTPKDEQFYWAITDPDGTPRASYNLIKGKLP